MPQIRHHPPPPLKISLREPSEQSHFILRYSAELRLQTWNANSTMPEVHVHTYCATDMPLVGKQKLKNCPELAPYYFSSHQFAATVEDIDDILATHYIFSYGTGSPTPMSTNSTPQCTSSSCQHTFRATSHHVQQYTVSVAARNVIGVGTASTPVTVGM